MKFLTKNELIIRWSKSLVNNYGKLCQVVRTPNRYGGADIYLYPLSEIERVEQLPEFIRDRKRINKQRADQKVPIPKSNVLF